MTAADVTVITPCSRPGNLMRLWQSIPAQATWLVVLDSAEPIESRDSNRLMLSHCDPLSVGGNAQRNYALDRVETPYVYFLDDDNIIHPDFFAAVFGVMHDGDMVAVDQVFADGKPRLTAGDMRQNHCDTAQFLTPMSTIGDVRWRVDIRCQDGIFFPAVYARSPSKLRIMNEPLSYWNYLRP